MSLPACTSHSRLSRLSRLPRLVAVASMSLALTGGLVACGGDDSSEPAAGKAPSSAAPGSTAAAPGSVAAQNDKEFAAQANAVCETAYPKINKVLDSLDPKDPKLAEAVLNDYVPVALALQDDFLSLVGPKKGKNEKQAKGFTKAVAAQRASVERVVKNPKAVFKVRDAAYLKQFDKLGMTSCGTKSGKLT